MPKHKTSRRQLGSPTKNQFIGTVRTHHNVARACADYSIKSSTGYDLWNKFLDTGSASNRPRSGRPSKLSESEKENVRELATHRHRKPFCEIGNELMPPVCATTVRSALAETGYHRRVAKKVPYLPPAAKQKRLTWANEMVSMTEEDWSNVAWSDEAYVCLGENKGRVWVTRRPGRSFWTTAVSQSSPSPLCAA
jgi:transposase